MAKKKNNETVSTVLNLCALVFAVAVIVSFFLRYYVVKVLDNVLEAASPTGWQIFKSDGDGDIKTYIVFSFILAIAAAAIAALRLINFPLAGTKLFSFIFMGVGVVMLVFAILTMVGLKDSSFSVGNAASGKLGFGVILNLIGSILVTCCSAGAFLTKK